MLLVVRGVLALRRGRPAFGRKKRERGLAERRHSSWTAHDRLCRSSALPTPKRNPPMKTTFSIAVLAVLLVVPSPCFALWTTVSVSKERVKELCMEVRTTATGPNHVVAWLEF